jgi:hypothetical protein
MEFVLKQPKNKFSDEKTIFSSLDCNAEWYSYCQGIKTLEVRSWIPTQLPVKDLLIVENQNFLVKDTDEEKELLSL